MASIHTAIELQDNFSRVLYGIIGSVNTAISAMDSLSQSMNQDVSAAGLKNARQTLNESTAELQKMNSEMNKMPETAQRVEGGFKGWQKAVIVANQAVSLVSNTLGKLGVTDVAGAFDRIDTMNRFNKTVSMITGDTGMANAAMEQLKNTTLGTAYGLDVASKATQGLLTRGMSLGGATDQVRVWADAVSFYGEGTNEQLESVIDAIGKMYSKGTVEADQLDRLFDAGIGAAEIYANAVGQSVSTVKDNLSSGRISAQEFINTVSQALDSGVSNGAAQDAGSTWATTFANMGSAITRGWTNIIANLDAALASHGLPSSMELVANFGYKIEDCLNIVAGAMSTIIDIAITIFDVMSDVGSFIADNWSLISPVIYGVVTALGVYYTWQMLSTAASAIAAVGKGLLAAATVMTTSATWAQTKAQMGLNGAMYSCPILWIILLIIALIAVILFICSAIAKATESASSGFGFICGVVAAAGAAIWNSIVGLVNLIIGIGIELYNLIAAFANFFANVFNDPIGAIINMFAGLLDFIIGIVQSAAEVIDAVLGSDLSGAVQGFRNEFADSVADIVGDQTVVMEKLNAQDYMIDRIGYKDAFDSGAAWGDKMWDKLPSFNLKDLTGKDKGKGKIPDPRDYTNALNNSGIGNNLANTASGVGDTAKNTAQIADSVAITSEDLKYLRDIAEQEIINRFTTAEIKVSMTNQNTVNSTMDLDGVAEHLRTRIEEEMNAAAEGVH